jgi:arylsulfatase A-like enzyme
MAYEPDKFPGINQKIVKKHKDVIPKSYIQADKMIGKILAETGPEACVFVVSDHGFKAISGGMTPYDINIENFLEILGIKEKVIVARFGPGMYLNFTDKQIMHNVELAASSVFIHDSDEKIFNVKCYDNTLIITKPNWKVDVKKLKQKDLNVNFGKFGIYKLNELYTRQERKMSGVHKKEGILVMSGPDIKSSQKLEPVSIYDIAPTILHLMRFPVAKDMDGRVLTEALDSQFLEMFPISYVDTFEDSVKTIQEPEDIDRKKIEERLKSLGYL